MKIYLVGGAVRDRLLGEPETERDWVVVGATAEEMLASGYKQVGKGFPVFLHPQTHEEYALARIDRKTGKGYTQFFTYSSPDVSLEEDLKRRDLTINAMAISENGELIDPYGGQEDLKNKIMRHVSPAFAEDPLRVLRVARFAARLGDFQVHAETMALLRQIVAAGEIEALIQERVWQELERALHERYPVRFFLILKECHSLRVLFPEIEAHFTEAMTALKTAARLSQHSEVRLAAVLHDCNLQEARNLCKRTRVPKHYRELVLLVVKNRRDFDRALQLNAARLMQLLNRLDAQRRNARFHQFLLACESNSSMIPSLELLRLKAACDLTWAISVKPLVDAGLQGEDLKKAILKERIKALQIIFLH